MPAGKVSHRRYCTRACATASYNRTHLTGARNGRWRGGRALSYGPHWKAIKEQVRRRDGACRACGKTAGANGRALDVHHLRPYRFSGDNSLDNLVALCRSCHMRADDHGRKGSARFLREGVQLELHPPSQRELRRRRGARRRHDRDRLRAEALEMRLIGRSLRQIARTLGVSHQTVANWVSGLGNRLVS